MKLIIDLFPCQTNTRFRGIGRYILSLLREMARLRGSNEIYALADIQLSESFEELRQEFTGLLPTGSFLPYHNGLTNSSTYNSETHKLIADTLVRQAYQTLSPDVVLTPSPFEMELHGVVPGPNAQGRNYKQVGILYDLIPTIFHEQYLDGNPEYKKKYTNILNTLPNYDLLLAISESSRQDAIKILDIKPEKIVNISGAVGSRFRRLGLSQSETSRYMDNFGITRPFILYIGGNNFRKNMEGALSAYAQLPPQIIASHQFVVNDVGDEAIFRSKARALGLNDQDLVVTGYTSDDDLIALYNLCKAFIFPSLYEGFGLPILEAMACGAPVIASDNSSIPEVVGRSDVLFNVSDHQEVTKVLHKVLTDDAFRNELSEYGLERVKQFSWEKTAQQAWAAMETVQEEKKKIFKAVSSHSQSHPRIAFVSPLPPQKTGISNYSAELLPYLAKYFDINLFIDPDVKVSNAYLRKNFPIYDWNKLLEMRDRYETVVYHYGNSPFHSHMFDLERQFHGVVVLHDFFLSNLAEHFGNQHGSLQNEVDNSHGLKGLIDLQTKKNGMLKDWPINWKVLRNANEIIVHSNFQNQLLNLYYGRGWRPSLTVIPHLRKIVPEVTKEQQLQARKELGISPDDFIFCSFGMLTPHKLNEPLIQIYASLIKELGNDTKLFFVGESSSQQEKALIEQLQLSDQVYITGYVNDETYKKYLISANAAIQLRKNSRGETSGAVLDCMNYGLSTIVNAHGTLEDLDKDCVVKISDPIQLEELGAMMVQLRRDEGLRLEKGRCARKSIADEHDPEKVAEAYAEVIYKSILTDDRRLFMPLIKTIKSLNQSTDLMSSTAKFAAMNLSLRSQPRLLIDVTQTTMFDARSGIQRVVKSIVRELFLMDDPSLQVEPFWLNQGQFLRGKRFTERLLSLPDQSLGPETPIYTKPGDTIFMLDSSWHLYDQFVPLFQKARENGGKIVTAFYDLIPKLYPEMVDKTMECVFTKWMDTAVQQSDVLVCISRSTADNLKANITDNKIPHTNKQDIEYFHLGADIPVVSSESKIRFEVSSLTNVPKEPLFIMVGTLEPRKGHEFVLDAFEAMWQQGINYRLCFAGKIGWHVEKLEQRIRNHSESGKRLLFFENPTDAEINRCYQAATALIAASITEGFGLPIIEAAQNQVPVLASDIPVFREVGGEGAVYFSLSSPSYLVEAIHEMAAKTSDERVALSKQVKYITWKKSAESLLKILERNRN
jgi:glycosyltransferase involved in cell wall biosynthesis